MVERSFEITPNRVLRVLNENYGKPVSGNKISEVVWGDKYRISDSYIRALIERCRFLIPERIKRENTALYSLYHSTSYMLTNQLELGSWVSMPFEEDSRMGMLSTLDLDLIHQRKVEPEYRLVSRISPMEYNFLGLLSDFTQKNEGRYVSVGQLAMACYGFEDEDEHHCVCNHVCRLRKKIQCLTSVEIQSESNKGYKLVKKS